MIPQWEKVRKGQEKFSDQQAFHVSTVHMSLFALVKYIFITNENVITSKVMFLVCIKQISLLKNNFVL